MKVLVTGSTGFIGGRLCRALVERGDEVRAFHRSTSSGRALEGLEVEHVIGDLTHPETLAGAMQGIEAVFHSAALLGGREEPGRMYAVTVEGTRAILQAAKEAGVKRVVHTSSVAALGVPDVLPFRDAVPVLMDENHTWNYAPNRWPYGYAKYLAELEVMQAVAAGLDVVIVNPSLVFGAGDVYRQSSSLVVQIARQRLPVSVEGGVNAVHIDDVVGGHLAALECGRCGERYILGGLNLTIPELMRRIAECAGVQPNSLVMPASAARLLVTPMWALQTFIPLPVNANLFALAGNYFYYETRKAQVELGLPPFRPVEDAFVEALDWFGLKKRNERTRINNQPGDSF